MPDPTRRAPRWNRRGFLRAGAAATAAAGALAAGLPGATPEAAAHNLKPGRFGSPLYTAALEATGGVKGIFQSPNLEATVVAGKNLNHLLLVQLKN